MKISSLIGVIACLTLCSTASAAEYVGAETCGNCHAAEYARWQDSHHARAMEPATKTSVLAAFDGEHRRFHDRLYRPFERDGEFLVNIPGPDGERAEYPVRYTFGFSPLQQYLVELPGGRMQALNMAWDARASEEGGQRWFHLRADEPVTPQHPFYWSRYFQNWNARCAECHSTGVDIGFEIDEGTFDTRFEAANVTCEACHGPGADHVSRARFGRLGDGSGLAPVPVRSRWERPAGDRIAHRVTGPVSHEPDTCVACHARRQVIDSGSGGAGLHRVEWMAEPLYFPDGQIREEVFVLGSFLQSKMAAAGVTCSNCHDAHSGELVATGNGLCTQCHAADAYDTVKHVLHEKHAEAGQCVTCHMPARTYMSVDDRRDHQFTIPRPGLPGDLGIPNACTGCHADRDDAWAAAVLVEKGRPTGSEHWAAVSARIQNGDALALSQFEKALDDPALTSFTRGSLFSQLAAITHPSVVGLVEQGLSDPDPVVRRGAIDGSAGLAPDRRGALLLPLVEPAAEADADPLVRYALGSAFAAIGPALRVADARKVQPLIADWQVIQERSAYAPASQLSLGGLALAAGDVRAAETALRRALAIESTFVPARLNLADLYRATGRDAAAGELLAETVRIAPDSAAALHGYGLWLVRQKQYEPALGWLGKAVTQTGATPRFAWVYAVAQDNLGATDDAIATLAAADRRWPNQVDVLRLLVTLLDRSGKTMTIRDYLDRLEQLAPDAPEVRLLRARYPAARTPRPGLH